MKDDTIKAGKEEHKQPVAAPSEPPTVVQEAPHDDAFVIQRAYRNLLKSFKTDLNKEDKEQIRAAFELAAKAHQEQRRKSGEPYILHPIEVAHICVDEIGLGPTAVVCALLL